MQIHPSVSFPHFSIIRQYPPASITAHAIEQMIFSFPSRNPETAMNLISPPPNAPGIRMDKTSIGPATAAAPGIRLYKSLFLSVPYLLLRSAIYKYDICRGSYGYCDPLMPPGIRFRDNITTVSRSKILQWLSYS